MDRRILVAGATGRLGREVVRELHERGFVVRALARDAEKLRDMCPDADEVVVADACECGDLRTACAGVHTVVSCMGASVMPRLREGRQAFSSIDVAANLRLI